MQSFTKRKIFVVFSEKHSVLQKNSEHKDIVCFFSDALPLALSASNCRCFALPLPHGCNACSHLLLPLSCWPSQESTQSAVLPPSSAGTLPFSARENDSRAAACRPLPVGKLSWFCSENEGHVIRINHANVCSLVKRRCCFSSLSTYWNCRYLLFYDLNPCSILKVLTFWLSDCWSDACLPNDAHICHILCHCPYNLSSKKQIFTCVHG